MITATVNEAEGGLGSQTVDEVKKKKLACPKTCTSFIGPMEVKQVEAGEASSFSSMLNASSSDYSYENKMGS